MISAGSCISLQDELLVIHQNCEELTEDEHQIIIQYRRKPELQKAVRILLGIE